MTDPGVHTDLLLECQALTKEFYHRGRTLRVLDEMDLRIPRGDMIAIMGKSGAGKSTLLQILGTLDRPTSGTVLWRGDDLFARSRKRLAAFRNRSVGFVFQFHHLLPEFTALENVMMPGLIARQKRGEAQERAEDILERVGLAERLHHQPGELSGGEQQRVAIARALFMKPALLLADEPTGNLDLKTGAGIHEVLRELNEQMGITVLLVTHDPRLALEMPTRLAVEEGKIVPIEEMSALSISS